MARTTTSSLPDGQHRHPLRAQRAHRAHVPGAGGRILTPNPRAGQSRAADARHLQAGHHAEPARRGLAPVHGPRLVQPRPNATDDPWQVPAATRTTTGPRIRCGSCAPSPIRPARRRRTAPPTYANTATHWWDGSQLYGSGADMLRQAPLGHTPASCARRGRPAPARPERRRSDRGERQLVDWPEPAAHAVHPRAQRHLRPARPPSIRPGPTTNCSTTPG